MPQNWLRFHLIDPEGNFSTTISYHISSFSSAMLRTMRNFSESLFGIHKKTEKDGEIELQCSSRAAIGIPVEKSSRS